MTFRRYEFRELSGVVAATLCRRRDDGPPSASSKQERYAAARAAWRAEHPVRELTASEEKE